MRHLVLQLRRYLAHNVAKLALDPRASTELLTNQQQGRR
jgi:hypothetical protein